MHGPPMAGTVADRATSPRLPDGQRNHVYFEGFQPLNAVGRRVREWVQPVDHAGFRVGCDAVPSISDLVRVEQFFMFEWIGRLAVLWSAVHESVYRRGDDRERIQRSLYSVGPHLWLRRLPNLREKRDGSLSREQRRLLHPRAVSA